MATSTAATPIAPETAKPVSPPLRRRLISCYQSTGRVGKSMTAEGILMWLRFAEVPHVVIDADAEHRTLSRRYPDANALEAVKSVDDFGLMVCSLPEVPVTLVDYPAQATAFLLDASAHLRLLDYYESSGIRPTMLIFAADDVTAKESAAKVVRAFGERADYLLIENPARFRSAAFRSTKLYDWFQERKTPTIRVPAITLGTIALWEKLERCQNRYMSFDDARRHEGLHRLCRGELDHVRNRLLVQCEDAAERIVPDPALIKRPVPRVEKKAAEQAAAHANPLEDELLA